MILLTSFDAFKKIESPHAEVHKNGLAALVAHADGITEEAVKRLSLMESASFKVVDLLSALSLQISNAAPKHVEEDELF